MVWGVVGGVVWGVVGGVVGGGSDGSGGGDLRSGIGGCLHYRKVRNSTNITTVTTAGHGVGGQEGWHGAKQGTEDGSELVVGIFRQDYCFVLYFFYLYKEVR